MSTVTMKASELIEDFAIYPRNCVFNGHVHDLGLALKAGAVFPPIVADKKSKRITDGFHRRRSAVSVSGDDTTVEVQLIDYKSEADMVRDSMVRNAAHGRRLTTADIARCAQLGKKYRIGREELAGILHITRDKLKDITATRFASGEAGQVLLRRPMSHLAGTQLSPAQEKVADHVGGMTALTHANRLIDLIESQSLPPDNDTLIDRLRHLHGLLESLLVVA